MKIWELSFGESGSGTLARELFFHFEDAKKMATEWITKSTLSWHWDNDSNASANANWDARISIEQIEVK